MSEILFILSSYKTGALLPALQSLLTGVIVALVVLALSGESRVALLSGGIVAGVAWLFLLSRWLVERQAVFYALAPEPVIINEAPEKPEPTVIHIHEGNETRILVLNVEPEKLRALAYGLERGVPLAEKEWCGSGKTFSVSQFRELRNELLSRKLLRWRNESSPAQGVELSPGGRAFIRYCLSIGSNRLPLLTHSSEREHESEI